jgi:multiple antibiotic resistance protein
MPEFSSHWLYEFVTLLVILDPIATVPLFMSVTMGLERREALKVALYALLTALAILVFFIVFGQVLLEALKIPMASFQLAGSLLFLVLGIQMATGQLGEQQLNSQEHASNLFSRALYPLAAPGIAGGGAILTVVLLTDNRTRSIEEQASTVAVLITCLSVHMVSFFFAGFIQRWLGVQGIAIISRVFGLILTSIAVNGIIVAIKLSFSIGE